MKENTTTLGGKSNPLFHLFSQTWRYSEGNRKNVKLYWLLFIVGNTISLICQPLLMAKIMNIMQKDGVTKDNINHIVSLLILNVFITVVFWTMHGPARILERANAFKVRASYRKSLLKGVMSLPLDWHTEHHSGDTIDKIEKGANSQYAFSAESFQVISSLAQLVVSYGMLAYFSWPSAIIVLCMISLTVFITMQFDRRIIANYKVLNRTENQISASVFDTVSNITTVVILRVEKLVFDAISHKIDSPFKLYCKNSIQIETKWFLTSMCSSSMIVIVLLAYCIQQLYGKQMIMISSVYLLMKYLGHIEELFFHFTGMYGEMLQRHSRVLNAEELAKDFQTVNFTNHVLPDDWRDISISNLNFSYRGEGKDMHLEDVSFTMRRGERIALVGESGSGKTTFLKIMRGLHDPASINLSVDGKSISDGFNGISRAITLVPQLPEIFATTIGENITLGAEYSDEVIGRSMNMACFSSVVERLPHGLGSVINEKGVNLSGGQQQRLALARGFLACQGKSLILLDEPTSNVDAENERRIYENINREFQGKTIIASIHGLHLLQHFDRVVMFSKGRIIASGTLHELLATCPQFGVLWSHYSKRDKSRVAEEV